MTRFNWTKKGMVRHPNGPFVFYNQAIKRAKDRHYFTPCTDNTDFCARCGKYFVSNIHLRWDE
jgi:hypothetical protein